MLARPAHSQLHANERNKIQSSTSTTKYQTKRQSRTHSLSTWCFLAHINASSLGPCLPLPSTSPSSMFLSSKWIWSVQWTKPTTAQCMSPSGLYAASLHCILIWAPFHFSPILQLISNHYKNNTRIGQKPSELMCFASPKSTNTYWTTKLRTSRALRMHFLATNPG